jgi:hypothetical protein
VQSKLSDGRSLNPFDEAGLRIFNCVDRECQSRWVFGGGALSKKASGGLPGISHAKTTESVAATTGNR